MMELLQSQSGLYIAIALIFAGFSDMALSFFFFRKRAEATADKQKKQQLQLVKVALMSTGFFIALAGFYALDMYMGG